MSRIELKGDIETRERYHDHDHDECTLLLIQETAPSTFTCSLRCPVLRSFSRTSTPQTDESCNNTVRLSSCNEIATARRRASHKEHLTFPGGAKPGIGSWTHHHVVLSINRHVLGFALQWLLKSVGGCVCRSSEGGKAVFVVNGC